MNNSLGLKEEADRMLKVFLILALAWFFFRFFLFSELLYCVELYWGRIVGFADQYYIVSTNYLIVVSMITIIYALPRFSSKAPTLGKIAVILIMIIALGGIAASVYTICFWIWTLVLRNISLAGSSYKLDVVYLITVLAVILMTAIIVSNEAEKK